MKNLSLFLLFFSGILVNAQDAFNSYFTEGSLRIDYIMAGNDKETQVYLLDMCKEPFWGGPKRNLVTPLEYGEYMIRLIDKASGNCIYSLGFSTLFNEWQTTAEAKSIRRAYHQSAIMPYPKMPCTFEIYLRNKEQRFDKIYSLEVDPASYFIRVEPPVNCHITKWIYNGDPADKVDLAVLAEGYTAEQMEKFRQDAGRLMEDLLNTVPFNEYRDRFNIWLVESASQQEGTDVPGERIYVNTIASSSYYTFDLARYLTTPEFIELRNLAANVPYDQIIVLINSSMYGGGGIYNHYTASTVDHSLSATVLIHEFGHGFAGLGDEYYSSDVAYEEFYKAGVEPWEPNLTTLTNFESKWKDMLAPEIPIPTPPEKQYENVVGVFEGGGYSAKGIYRPAMDCRMKSNEAKQFCPVCQRAIVRMIKYYTE
jgi:hypothetical protein